MYYVTEIPGFFSRKSRKKETDRAHDLHRAPKVSVIYANISYL